jgi:hypothetical protein
MLVSHIRRLPKRQKTLLKRGHVVGPMICLMDADVLLDRNRTKGAFGAAMHLCGAGHNVRTIPAHLRALYVTRIHGACSDNGSASEISIYYTVGHIELLMPKFLLD